LAFKKPKMDTCHKFDVFQTNLKVAANNEGKKEIEEQIGIHHKNTDDAYITKNSDKQLAKQDNSSKCYAFDLQQCLPTLFVNSSVAFCKSEKVVLCFDTCRGQNCNSHVAAMFFTFMQQNTKINTIDHKFRVSGYGHTECNVDHTLIEKQKKKLPVQIEHPMIGII
ncbi:hypothetical protein ILUMI_16684, partial [Ignelater luminosus]